jgi:hypothetical protein
LLVFAFWHHQKTGFEASERNKDASHAPIALKLTLDVLHAIRVAAFLARASPNHEGQVWIVFFFLRTILLRRRGIFAFLPARKCSKMHAKAVLQQEGGGICTF